MKKENPCNYRDHENLNKEPEKFPCYNGNKHEAQRCTKCNWIYCPQCVEAQKEHEKYKTDKKIAELRRITK